MLPLQPSFSIWRDRSDGGPRRETVRKAKSRRSFLLSMGFVAVRFRVAEKHRGFYRCCDITRGRITAVNCQPSRERATELDWKHPVVKNASVQGEILFRRNGGAQENRDAYRKSSDCRKIWMYVSLLYFSFVRNASVCVPTLFHSFSRINRYFGWEMYILHRSPRFKIKKCLFFEADWRILLRKKWEDYCKEITFRFFY